MHKALLLRDLILPFMFEKAHHLINNVYFENTGDTQLKLLCVYGMTFSELIEMQVSFQIH